MSLEESTPCAENALLGSAGGGDASAAYAPPESASAVDTSTGDAPHGLGEEAQNSHSQFGPGSVSGAAVQNAQTPQSLQQPAQQQQPAQEAQQLRPEETLQVTSAPACAPNSLNNAANSGAHAAEAAGATAAPEEDKNDKKIFVGGLNRSTTAESLIAYFSAFGKVSFAEVLFDKITGRSRGFGFVSFEDASALEGIVDKHHAIDDSQVEVRRAIPREEARQGLGKNEKDLDNARVFVGGLDDEVTDEVLRNHFSQFGELSSASVMIDRASNRPRGFGFVIYKTPEDADKALGPHKELGTNCEAKKAQPRAGGLRGGLMMGGQRAPVPGGVYVGGYARAGAYGTQQMRGGGGRDYDYQMGGYGGQPGMYNYAAYHPYYAAYYAPYGAVPSYGYATSPSDGGPPGGVDRSSRAPSNRSTPY